MRILLLALLAFSCARQVRTEQAPSAAPIAAPRIGQLTPGRWNAITDVAGVLVGHATIVHGEGSHAVRTGVTAVLPREDVWENRVFAAAFVLNGNGQLTGMPWIEESELLGFPILLTNSASVGRVYDAAMAYLLRRYPERDSGLQLVVAECWDGLLNDIRGLHVQPEHVDAAIDGATGAAVESGAVGAGTGMVCYGFKGGIGTASRVLPPEKGGYTVGALVLTNHGSRRQLTIDGVPVGREIRDLSPEIHAQEADRGGSSVIMILATDAPLSARQLERLARRATLGLARTGATAHSSSGDIAIAFSTAQSVPVGGAERVISVRMLRPRGLDALLDAAAEATEAAVIDSLLSARTMTGVDGNTVFALPHDRLQEIMRRYGRQP